jgi:Ca-activated chloride channel homolog
MPQKFYRKITIFISLALAILLVNLIVVVAQTPTPLPTATPDEEVIKVDTTLVSLPVSVMNRDGKFIQNLQRGDFHIFENGVEQDIEYFAPVEEPFTVVLLIDRSDSVKPIIDDVKKASLAFIDQLRPNDRVVGIAFDRNAYFLNKKVRDRETLRTAIQSMTTGAGTYLHETIEGVINRIFKGLPGRKALILFTDGQEAWDWDHPKPAVPKTTAETNLRVAEETGTFVYSIQFDSNFRSKEGDKFMKDFAVKTGGQFYRADKLKDFNKVFSQIADELRFQYSIGYYPKITATKGERRQIKVSVNQPETIIRTRDSYVFAK